MFIDTKNLANANCSATAVDVTSECSKARGVRKVWQPLLRLISSKSAKRRGGNDKTGSTVSGSSCAAHPNNVNLNNANNAMDGGELSVALLQDYASVIRKVSTKEECSAVASDAPCQASAKHTTVISSASIEKTPAPSCAHCIYGRNCHHELFHHVAEGATAAGQATYEGGSGSGSISNMACQPTAGQPLADVDELIDLPIHYIRTDDGTFFWTTAQDKIDDDLLTAWLCHSFRQSPVATAFV